MERRKKIRAWRRKIYDKLPAWMRKNDFQLFASFLCFVGGFPLLFTSQVEASSLEAALPMYIVKVWAAILTLAPFAIVTGLYMSHGKPIAYVTFWMRLEAAGLKALAYAGYLYAAIVMLVTQGTAAPGAAIILIFALTCHSRATGVSIKVDDYLEGIGVET